MTSSRNVSQQLEHKQVPNSVKVNAGIKVMKVGESLIG